MLQVPSIPVPSPELLQRLFLVLAVLGSLAVARALDPADRRWGDVLRERWVLGVPWGTVLTVLAVASVYWFLQGGLANPRNPVVTPYRAWSYRYPLGILASGFAHSGTSHLTGNMIGTVVFAPVVEYAIGHYPRERGTQAFTSLQTNPFARIFAVPLFSLVVGVLTGMFALGAVVGFSGVVFAFAGFAFVTRPLLAVGALVSEQVVDLLYRSLRTPSFTAEATSRFVTPWWADIAIQGHALGLLVGFLLGAAYLRRRGETPPARYLWFAALIFAIDESLWAVYAPVGANQWALYRALGVGLSFVLAALLVSAVSASDRPLIQRIDLRRGEAARGLVAAVLLAFCVAAVPFNVAPVDAQFPEGTETVEIRDYTVGYAEGIPDQYVAAVDTSLLGEERQIRSSGVIVASDRRNAWIEAVSAGQLAFSGQRRVTVGGPGWRESVVAARDGWSPVGNGSAYVVSLRRTGEEPRVAFVSEPSRAEPVVAGRHVTIDPTRDGFLLRVTRDNETLGAAPIPGDGNETRIGGVTFNRTGRQLFAEANDTRVRIANEEIPEGRRN